MSIIHFKAIKHIIYQQNITPEESHSKNNSTTIQSNILENKILCLIKYYLCYEYNF